MHLYGFFHLSVFDVALISTKVEKQKKTVFIYGVIWVYRRMSVCVYAKYVEDGNASMVFLNSLKPLCQFMLLHATVEETDMTLHDMVRMNVRHVYFTPPPVIEPN